MLARLCAELAPYTLTLIGAFPLGVADRGQRPARLLDLPGDPYAALLALEGWPPHALRELVERALANTQVHRPY